LLPAIEFTQSQIEQVVDMVDLIVLTGGLDIQAAHYGKERTRYHQKGYTFRDRLELDILRCAVEKRKPLFGICRGMQLMNVGFGGTLHADVAAHSGSPHMHRQQDMAALAHTVYIQQDTWLHSVMSKTEISVNSFHHQAIEQLGKDLRITATSDDGLIEAVEHETLPIVGVQWHPEISYSFDECSRRLIGSLELLALAK